MPLRGRGGRTCGRGGRTGDRFDGVRLDQWVRQELTGEALDDRAGRRLVGGLDRELDTAADPDRADAADPEMVEAALDGTSLRIEDAGLRGDVDGVAGVLIGR